MLAHLLKHRPALELDWEAHTNPSTFNPPLGKVEPNIFGKGCNEVRAKILPTFRNQGCFAEGCNEVRAKISFSKDGYNVWLPFCSTFRKLDLAPPFRKVDLAPPFLKVDFFPNINHFGIIILAFRLFQRKYFMCFTK